MGSFTGNRSLILLLTVLFCHLYPTKNYQKIQASGLFYQAAKKYSSCVLLPKKRVTCQAVILQMMLFCMAWKTVIKCTISNCVLTTMLSRTQKIAPITISFQFAKRAFLNGSLAKKPHELSARISPFNCSHDSRTSPTIKWMSLTCMETPVRSNRELHTVP